MFYATPSEFRSPVKSDPSPLYPFSPKERVERGIGF